MVPTSLIWCKAKLATNILIFFCLHIKYKIKVVDINVIIEEMITKCPRCNYLFEKKYLLVLNVVSCLSCKAKSKNFFSFGVSIDKIF